MKVELIIYIYFALCVSMILFNIVYVFILRHRDQAYASDTQKMLKLISAELDRIDKGEGVDQKHKKYLAIALQKTSLVTAFDKALEELFQNRQDTVKDYFQETFSVFEFLTQKYLSKDTIKIAYFPYLLDKYDIVLYGETDRMIDILMNLLRSVNIYCRENALKAIYSKNDETLVASALRIIDKNLTFHHPKLITDGLFSFCGDRQKLKDCLISQFDEFSVQMQVNILNYFRFASVSCEEEMLELLENKKINCEIHFCAIRYFEKFPSEKARPIIQSLAENLNGLSWEYQALASSALKSYPDDVTFRILLKNLSSSNWYIRLNSAISCEKLGYTYHDLITVFDGNDRYAREILRYRLERRKAEEAGANS